MKWIGTQTIYDQVRFKKNITLYSAINDANPSISIGSSADERMQILATYSSGTQTLEKISFQTYTASGTADMGRFHFTVDEDYILKIDNGGIDFDTGCGISINGTDILTDEAGTATLSNIDALDATTIATIEAAVEANIDSLTGPIGLSNGSSSGGTALTIDNDDVDQIALDIRAENTTADVVNIEADAVTTANVIDVSCDALTTGSALKIEDDSSATGFSGARNVVDIYQKNATAENATALQVKSDGGQYGVLIDKNASGDGSQNRRGLYVDFDRTVPGSGTNAHNDVGVWVDVDSASLGTSTLKGMVIDVNGATSGTSAAYGLDINVSGADANAGVNVETSGSYGLRHKNTIASSATEGGKINLISNDGAALGNDHRLGVVQFHGYDGSGDPPVGAKIQAVADAAWSTTVNDTRLEFYTNDGDDNSELSLTLDSNLLATFVGGVTVGGTLTVGGAGIEAVQASDESFVDNDTSLMTSAAINDRIESFGYTTSTGDITGVRITTDTGGGGIASVASGSADFSILGASGVGVTNSGETITAVAVPGEIDHDSLLNFAADEHFTQANITTVGTIGTGVWQGTAIASAYLDADTAHYSATRQVTHHTISDDIDSDVVFISLGEIDAETTSVGNKALPIIAPAAGKLLKIFCRTSANQSSETFTWKLYTRTVSQSTNGNAAEIGAQSGAGPTNKTMVTYDFTTGLDSGTNAIAAGDKVQISIEASDGGTANSNYFITCLWEWDLS